MGQNALAPQPAPAPPQGGATARTAPAAPGPSAQAHVLQGRSGYDDQSDAVKPGTFGASPTTPPNRAVGAYAKQQQLGDAAGKATQLKAQLAAARAALAKAQRLAASTPILDAAGELVVDEALGALGPLGEAISQAKDAHEVAKTALEAAKGEASTAELATGGLTVLGLIAGELPGLSTMLNVAKAAITAADGAEKKAAAKRQLRELGAQVHKVADQLKQVELEVGKLEGRTGMLINVQA